MPIDPARSALIDAMRGVSAHVVAAVHLAEVMLFPLVGRSHWSFLLCGALAHWAVIIFFVLSGFVISASLHRHSQREGVAFWREFALGRIVRIYPPLLFALTFTAFVIAVCTAFGVERFAMGGFLYLPKEEVRFDSFAFIGAALNLQAFEPALVPRADSPLWSLGYEWWFYVICAALVGTMFASLRGYSIALTIMVGACALLAGNGFQFFYLFGLWATGALAYLALLRTDKNHAALKRLHQLSVLGMAGVISLLVVIALQQWWPQGAARMVVEFWVAVTAGLLIMGWETRLVCDSIRRLSRYSYTLYVIHFPIYLLIFAFAHRTFLAAGPSAWIATTSMAYISAIGMSILTARYLEDTSRFRRLCRSYTATPVSP